MISNFVITLGGVRYEKSQSPEAVKTLSENYDEIWQQIKMYQLKKPNTLKRFAINTYNQILPHENRIRSWFDNIYEQGQAIIRTKKRGIKDNLTDSELKSLTRLEIEIEYYANILGEIENVTQTLIEFLAGYDPKHFANDEKLVEVVRATLPAWNPVRKTVLNLRQKNQQVAPKKITVKKLRNNYSYTAYAMALNIKNISIDQKGRGIHDGIDYVKRFGLKPGQTLYNKWNNLINDKIANPKKFEKPAWEIIKNNKM